MRGKYSPTVSTAYLKNQKWWDNFCAEEDHDGIMLKSLYDKEGYDCYGYDQWDTDRAGYIETDYCFNNWDHSDDEDFNALFDEDFNALYDEVIRNWGFDGEKPVRKA